MEAISKLEFNFIPPPSTFKCPYCGKEHSISEAKTEKILASSKHVKTNYRGRNVIYTYLDTYYNIRFCPKCYKRKYWTKRILYVSIFAIFTLILGLIYFRDSNGSVWRFLASLCIFYLLLILAVGLLNWILDKTIFAVDFEKAHQDNAIAPPED